MREAHGRVRFAGGDIAAVGVGGIDGAIETGAKAARDIIRALAANANDHTRPRAWSVTPHPAITPSLAVCSLITSRTCGVCPVLD
jgi:hypothetical protein